MKSLSPVRLLATPWTKAYQARLSMGFSRQEYWSGVTLPSVKVELGNIFYHLTPKQPRKIRRAIFIINSSKEMEKMTELREVICE